MTQLPTRNLAQLPAIVNYAVEKNQPPSDECRLLPDWTCYLTGMELGRRGVFMCGRFKYGD